MGACLGLDPDIIKLLLAAPWSFVVALIVWPDKGIIALWIKRNQAIKLAEIKRDKAKKAVQERVAERLTQAPPLLPAPKGEANDNAD